MKDFSELERVAEDPKEIAENNALASLESQLKKVEKDRKEDQFFFVLIVVIIFDAILFTHKIEGLAALTLGVLEIIFLMLLAHKCEVSQVEVIFRKVINAVSKNGNA